MSTYQTNASGPRRHIALFLPSLRGGGAERIMVILANGLAARGHRVDLVLVRAEGPYLQQVADNVRIVDLDKGRVMASLLPLVRYLRRQEPDAMLSAMRHANVIATLAKRLSGSAAPLAVSEHNNLAGLCKDLKGRIMLALMRWLYPVADRVVCVSKGIEEELHQIAKVSHSKLVTIHNPVEIDKVRGLAGEAAEYPWFEDHTSPVLLAVGRLVQVKDYPTLLAAFARLRADRDARLVILGQGEDEAQLKARAGALGVGDDVCFAGFQDNPFAFMARCDLYVMSSVREGFGNVLVEAMACGARVVSTNCPSGPGEILEGGRWGRLVPVGDADALARAMSETLDDTAAPDVRQRAEMFRTDVALDKYESILVAG